MQVRVVVVTIVWFKRYIFSSLHRFVFKCKKKSVECGCDVTPTCIGQQQSESGEELKQKGIDEGRP